MSNKKIKLPRKGGAEALRRKLKEMRRRELSPELVEIIEEVTHWEPKKRIAKPITPQEFYERMRAMRKHPHRQDLIEKFNLLMENDKNAAVKNC